MLWGLIKPNDWIIIHKSVGEYSYVRKKDTTIVVFYLKFSKSRNKYKIDYDKDEGVCMGNPKTFSGYQDCLNKQIELQSK